MDVTLLGIVTDVREVHLEKAPAPYESNVVIMIINNNYNNNNNDGKDNDNKKAIMIIIMTNNNINNNINGCNTIRNSNGCQGGARIKGIATL